MDFYLSESNIVQCKDFNSVIIQSILMGIGIGPSNIQIPFLALVDGSSVAAPAP